MSHRRVVIVGGGVTGLRSALALDDFCVKSTILEKKPEIGGRVVGYSKVFPDFRDGRKIVDDLAGAVSASQRIEIISGSTIDHVQKRDESFTITLSNESVIVADAVILTCGFETFDATRQGEYGYGVYPNVVTSVEMEDFLNPHGSTKGKLLRPFDGSQAKRVAIIFCVGSRNKRIGNPYCSRICCSYSTKQAIEIKEFDEEASVTCFYMDIRTYGRGLEEMYQYAQDIGVKYIRGRVSECSTLPNGDIQVRAENTLLGRPVQGIFDLVSLSVGMMPCADAGKMSELFGIRRGDDGFFVAEDEDLNPHSTDTQGVFIAGSVTGLKPIRDCLLDGASVAGKVASYLRRLDNK